VVDHEQQLILFCIHLGLRLRSLEKVTEPHELLGVGGIFCAVRVPPLLMIPKCIPCRGDDFTVSLPIDVSMKTGP
jgi:hypothetical protein